MKSALSAIFLFVLGCYNKVTGPNVKPGTEEQRKQVAQEVLTTPIKTIDGQPTQLKDYPAKAYLIVNTASKCGFTNQYEGLESLHKDLKDQGLVVMGFPSNDFGSQEPGTAEEIKSFCKLNFGVSFPLFEKGPVKGPEKQELFKKLLAASEKNSEILWNFEKFLLNAKGEVVQRYTSKVEPQSIKSDILKLL